MPELTSILVMRSIEDKEGAPVIETPSKMGLVSRV